MLLNEQMRRQILTFWVMVILVLLLEVIQCVTVHSGGLKPLHFGVA